MPAIRWEIDPGRSLRTGFHVDHAHGELTIVHEEDVEHVLKKNQQMFNASSEMVRRGEEWHLYARIPAGIVMKWKSELGVDVMKAEDWKKVEALLHDTDWSKLRTHAGNYQERPARQYIHTESRRNSRARRLVGRSKSLLRKGGRGA